MEARAQLAVLAAAGSNVDLGPKGYAAFVSDPCKAFQALSTNRAALAALEPELLGLVQSGEPGSVIYAALLLKQLGHDVRELLAPYMDDRRPCMVWPGGCGATTWWLAEAARWAINGELWSHPARLIAHDLDTLSRANWFELPSEQAIELKRNGARPRDIQGQWVHVFLDLLVGPPRRLREFRAEIEALLAHPSVATRLYAALLVREIDRATGERALAEIARHGGNVSRGYQRRLFRERERTSAVAALVEELVQWQP